MSFQPPPYRYVQAGVSNSNKSSLLEPCIPTMPSSALTSNDPGGQSGHDGRLLLAHPCQKREEQTVPGHGKDYTWEGEQGPQETDHGMIKKERKKAEQKIEVNT